LRTIVELTIVVMAVLGLTWVVITFARTGEASGSNKRTVIDPDDPDWLDLDGAASYLGVETGFVLNLVARDAIPFYVMAERDRTDSPSYRFRRDELDDWTVG
jgi:hypothetical protein